MSDNSSLENFVPAIIFMTMVSTLGICITYYHCRQKNIPIFPEQRKVPLIEMPELRIQIEEDDDGCGVIPLAKRRK